jgi:hypothetical protein
MGKDKFENELLIKYGLPEDVWFHVDNMSSAHVYLRRKRGENTLEGLDPQVLQDCAQLVKFNSIKGKKLPDVSVSYTMWSNLKKTPGMADGQVGFHHPRQVQKVHIQRDREIVRRVLKTMEERHPDLAKERADREELERREKREAEAALRLKEQEAIRKSKADAKLKSYDSLFEGMDKGGDDSDSDSSSGDKNYEDYESSFM